MNESTRRGFLAAAGVGAAGVAVLAVPGVSAAATAGEKVTLPDDAEGVLAAYINDVTSGEVTLMVEGHEYVVVDKQLVARLATAFAKAAK